MTDLLLPIAFFSRALLSLAASEMRYSYKSESMSSAVDRKDR